MVETMKHVKVKIGGKLFDADRYNLRVSEDWSKSESKMISLPCLRFYSMSQSSQVPTFILNGGPGQSNFGLGYVPYLLEKRDVVVVGYRGADGETRFRFPKVGRAFREFNFANPEKSFSRVQQAFLKECDSLTRRGYAAENYNVNNMVGDLEFARESLGYGKVSILSGSFGTRLALLWSSRYPNSIHRSVMVGASGPGRFVWEPTIISSQWEQIDELWKRDPARTDKAESIVQLTLSVLDNLPKRSGFWRLDRAKIEFLTHTLLFNLDSLGALTEAYLYAKKGKYNGLVALTAMFGMMNVMAPTIWGDFCLKGAVDYDPGREYQKEMLSSSKSFSSFGSYILFGWFNSAIAERLKLSRIDRSVPTTPVETLVISGSIDFSTPASFAKDEVLPMLSKGQQVVISEAGHINLWFGSGFTHLVDTFLDQGKVDLSRYKYAPLNFKRSIPLNMIGTALQVGVGATVAIGVLVIMFIAGKIVESLA